MIGFKHLKISLFAYWPTRKLAYFRYKMGLENRLAEANVFIKK